MNTSKAPVMVLFFNRPNCLGQVFSSIREYQPKELFLVQDGPRKNNEADIQNILKCREIVSDENIDWECTVHRNYSEQNMSCDYREFTGISWCFEYVDRLIILEDDCVPTNSFFTMCEECLEKYKGNSNIHSIVGFNRVGEYDSPYDYVFSMTSAGLGWATWKRVWNQIEENKKLVILDDNTVTDYLDKTIGKSIKNIYGEFIPYMKQTKIDNERANMITSWEKLVGFVLIANNMLTITPTKNMIKYIGVTENASHSPSDSRLLPHKVRKVLTQEAFELSEKLKHPPFIIRDERFEFISSKSMRYLPGVAHIESLLLKFKYVGIHKTLSQIFRERLKKHNKQ